MMGMGGRGLTLSRSLRYSILNHLSRSCHVASDALLSRSSSSSSPSSPFQSRLRTILRNEIQYQYDYAPPHQSLTELGRFVVEDVPGQQWIALRGKSKSKSGEDENIKIEATMFDGTILAPKSEDVRLHISMLVDIWRGNEEETDLMEFVCSAWPDSLEIHKVYIFKRPTQPQPQPQPQPYMGPDIKDSSNRLRTGLYEFLDARGINVDLSRLLHQYMMNKDRLELIHWLGKLQSYIEK